MLRQRRVPCRLGRDAVILREQTVDVHAARTDRDRVRAPEAVIWNAYGVVAG